MKVMSIIQFTRQMYNSTQKHYDEVMPELVPLQRKNTSPIKINKSSDDGFRSKVQENKIQSEVQSPAARDAVKVPQLDRVASKKMDEHIKKRQNEVRKQNEVSKNLISQMINKISLRSIAQENYPVSNQTIERLLIDLDDEIHFLTLQANKFQNSLLLNPTNQHIKKELHAVEKSLNQIKTIRELYQEKIENRGKISELQAKIMNLKSENRELKIKIARGIQKIQSHIHNLPCEKEKQLIEEVNKYKLALSREKEMRENLQSNISTIVLNFKRFYVQADEARKIVTQQLKNINQKQQTLNLKLDNLNHQKLQVKNHNHSNAGSSQAFFRQRRFTNRLTDEENMAEIINQINQKEKEKDKQATKLEKIEEGKRTNRDRSGLSQLGSTILNRQGSETSRNQFILEQQIQKMRTNQQNFRKITQKKF